MSLDSPQDSPTTPPSPSTGASSTLRAPIIGEKRPLPRGTAAYPRKRAVTACQVCRARRTKCDNRKPSCSFCLKVGAVCIQSPVDLSSFDPASIKILERLSGIEDAVKRCESALVTQTPDSTPRSTSQGYVSPILDRTRLPPSSIEIICRWPVLDFPCISRESEVALSARLSADVESVTSVDDLQPRLIRPLVDKFFRCVHVKNPILHEARTRRLVTHFCADGLDWSPESCLALLVLALGATATAFKDPGPDTEELERMPLARSFYRAAQKRLALTIEGPDRVLEAQCFFLCGVYAMTLFQRDTAWKHFLHALACCQNFQFLRHSSRTRADVVDPLRPAEDPEHPSLTVEQTIYWSSWKSERELRGEMESVDFSLSQAELAIYPPFFPTPPVNMSGSLHDTGETAHDSEQLSWYFYLSEISLRRLTSCIANGIIQLEAPGNRVLDDLAHATCIYESQAEEWVLKLPGIISLDSPPDQDDICHFVLRGHLIDLYEIMYWPFVDALVTGCPMDGDQLLVRSLVRKGLQKHVERLWVNQPGYKHRHHGTLFLLRTCARSALVLVAAALSIRSQLDRQVDLGVAMPLGWREAVLLALDMTRYWEETSVDSAYLARILEQAWKKAELLQI